MAKDGTRRGGRRVRAGDKPKALSDKIAEGKDADIMEFHAPELDAADLDDAADLTGADMPSPSAYLSAQQKNGKPLGADIVYKETWLWLKQRGCEKHVNKRCWKATRRHSPDLYSVKKPSVPMDCWESIRPPAALSPLRLCR